MGIFPVETDKKEFAAYRPLLDPVVYEEIKKRAKGLSSLKVAQINATAQGGGVVELLRSIIPLLNDLGIITSWFTLKAPDAFFEITKKVHNLIQGQPGNLTEEEKKFYLECNRSFAQAMKDVDVDLWVVHDPQPAAVILDLNFHPIIWRCHLDTSGSTDEIWDFFSFIKNYDKYIFSLPEYTNHRFEKAKTAIFSPATDPLSAKNWPLKPLLADSFISDLGVDPQKPIMTQVSRFDPWKDPLGVIEAYYLVKKEIPDIQLILTGEMAADDPEGARILAQVKEKAGSDPNIHLWPDSKRNDLKINAIQVASDVILQKSIKEGFGLTVAEAMWKGKVVVGGNCGGIKFQIEDGQNGFLVSGPQEAAEKVVWTLRHPEEAEIMGEKAKESVRQKFLIPRLLNNYLQLFEELRPQIGGSKKTEPLTWQQTEPVRISLSKVPAA